MSRSRVSGAAIARNVVSSSMGQVLSTMLSVCAAVVTARWLGASGRGVLSLVATGSLVTAIVLCWGLPLALTTYVAQQRMTASRAVAISVLVSLCALAGGAAIALWMAASGNQTDTTALLLPFGAFAVSLSLSQVMLANGLGRVDLGVINTIVTAGSMLVAYMIGWLVIGDGPAKIQFACVAWIAAQLTGDAIGWAFLKIEFRAYEPGTQVPTGEVVKYASVAYPGMLVGQLNARLDIIVLGALAGAAAVGVYSTAVLAAALVFIIPGALASSLSRPFGSKPDGAARLARLSAAAAMLSALGVGIVAVVVIALFAGPLLGEEFSDLAYPIGVMLPGMVVFAAAYPSSSYYGTALGRPELNTAVTAAALGIDIVLLLILGGRYGVMGAATASLFGYGAAGVLNLALISRFARPEAGWSARVMLSETRESASLALATMREAFSR